MPDLSIVLVTYGGAEQLHTTLQSIVRWTRAVGYELIVVDNAGAADVGVLARSYGARLLRPERNRGFAGGANLGLRQARGRYACLLNPDVVLADDALGALTEWLDEHQEAGGAAPVLLRPDGTPQPYSYGDAPSPAYLLRRLAQRLRGRHLHAWEGGAPRPVDWAAATCLVVRPGVARRVGPLDEQFFLYWEDVDWGMRFRAAGRPLWLLPFVRVVHIGGASVGAAAAEHYDRSLVRFLAKHYGGVAAGMAFWALRLYRGWHRTRRTRRIGRTRRSRGSIPPHPGIDPLAPGDQSPS